MTVRKKPRSESLLIEIRELTQKVREVRLELEELIKRPPDRPAWRMLSSHGERSVASDRERRRVRQPDRGSVDPDLPTAESDPEPDPDADR